MSQQNSQTIITQEIDGIDVIKGFGKLAIEPIETRKVAAVAIQDTDEFKAVKEKQDARNESARKAGEEHAKMKAAKNKTDKDKAWRACETHRNMVSAFESEIKELLPALKKKEQQVRAENAVYFHPKRGEIAKTDAEIQALRDVLESVQGSGFVDIDGNILEDNRGSVVCTQVGAGPEQGWSINHITTIGVKIPANGILYGDLTADQKKEVDLQIEINQAVGMSDAEKAMAKESEIDKAANEATVMRSKLEIQGASDALEQSQAWYNDRVAELDLIYGA
jgi:hypothetical protein